MHVNRGLQAKLSALGAGLPRLRHCGIDEDGAGMEPALFRLHELLAGHRVREDDELLPKGLCNHGAQRLGGRCRTCIFWHLP